MLLTLIREEHLIYYDIVDIDVVLSELNHQSFSFKQRQKLRNADRNERSLGWIFELSVHFFDVFLKALHGDEYLLMKTLASFF